MKRVLLIDADSVIPNLVLMKLSAYHKLNGDSVKLQRLNIPYYPNRKRVIHNIQSDYDIAYCSVVFEGTKDYIKGKGIVFGGTGFSLSIELPKHIEQLTPDYSIYPDNDTSYGFISRGCIRNCYFCKVPEKEGYIHQVNTIDNIVRHKKVKFLDNNILALPNHKEILEELINKNIRCQFNQGLDIRLVDEENSILLSNLRYLGNHTFAFDDWAYLKQIERKLSLLSWRKNWQLRFFVYCNPNMEIQNITNRIKYLKDRKCLPYIMRDITCWESKNNSFYIDIASWCNQPSLFKSMTFSEFLRRRYPARSSKERIANSESLYFAP